MSKVKEKTISSVASEMYDNMELSERKNGSKYYHCKKEISWQKDIIFKAHSGRLPDDTIYEMINDVLATLSDNEPETEDDARELIYEIEPPCYTSDLTKWLHSSNHNVYYLTEALEEFDCKDGFQALSLAYGKQQQEIGHLVLDGILEYIEE